MRTKLNEIRKEAEAQIRELVPEWMHLEIADFDMGDSPIVLEGDEDEDTYTLDRIYYHDGKLRFDISSSCNNDTLKTKDVPTDALCDIAEYLKEYEGDISEIISDTWLDHAHEVLDEKFPDADEEEKDVFACEDWQNMLSDEQNCKDFEDYYLKRYKLYHHENN